MGPKNTNFTSDECQCLLDIFDKIIRDNRSRRDGKTIDMYLATGEEQSIYEKLKKAGEFYAPANNF